MPFEPGQSGNPGGRYRGEKLWADALRLAVKRTDGDKTKLAQIAEKLVDEAVAGNIQAAKEIGDRLDGKAIQALEHSGPDGDPIEVNDTEAARRIAAMLLGATK